MLHLTTSDIESVLTMEEALDALRIAYEDMANNRAEIIPRHEIYTPTGFEMEEVKQRWTATEYEVEPPVNHVFKIMPGTVGSMDAAAVRINSYLMCWPTVDGTMRNLILPSAPGGQYTAPVLLFSTETGQLLSVMPDAYFQWMRVGATGGIAADLLARGDASEVGLLGAGGQAKSHTLAVDAVRELDEIRVYSPNTRERFAEEMNAHDEVNTRVVSVDTPEKACANADIVLCCTNQQAPVFTADLLEKGMHLGCVRHIEFDADTYAAADHVVMHDTSRTVYPDKDDPTRPEFFLTEGTTEKPHQRWNHPQIDEIDLNWADLPDIASIISDGIDRRPDDVTVFVSNVGLGIQFAAIGKRIYELASEQGLGDELDDEMWHQPYQP